MKEVLKVAEDEEDSNSVRTVLARSPDTASARLVLLFPTLPTRRSPLSGVHSARQRECWRYRLGSSSQMFTDLEFASIAPQDVMKSIK